MCFLARLMMSSRFKLLRRRRRLRLGGLRLLVTTRRLGAAAFGAWWIRGSSRLSRGVPFRTRTAVVALIGMAFASLLLTAVKAPIAPTCKTNETIMPMMRLVSPPVFIFSSAFPLGPSLGGIAQSAEQIREIEEFISIMDTPISFVEFYHKTIYFLSRSSPVGLVMRPTRGTPALLS